MKKLFLISCLLLVVTMSSHAQGIFNDIQNNKIKAKQSLLALMNVTVINPVEPFVQKHQTVLIREGEISAIGNTQDFVLPENACRIDLTDKYVIPGLIDGHVHLKTFPDIQLENALRWGITSIRSMGDNAGYIKLLKDDIEHGSMKGPDIYYSAIGMGDEFFEKNRMRVLQMNSLEYKIGEAPWLRIFNKTTNYDSVVSGARNIGATGIKLYSHITHEQLSCIVRKAHLHGLKVWSHPHLVYTDLKGIAEAGVDLITHASALLFPVEWNLEKDGYVFKTDYLESGRIDSILAMMKKNGILLEPTFAVGLQELSKQNVDSSTIEANIEVLRRALNLGITLVAGTDLPLPQRMSDKPILFQEIEYFIDLLGMKPSAALATATINNAQAIGMQNSLGSITPGKIADLVVLHKNPLENIKNLAHICFVIKKGEIIIH